MIFIQRLAMKGLLSFSYDMEPFDFAAAKRFDRSQWFWQVERH